MLPKEIYIRRYSYGGPCLPGYTEEPAIMADGENIKYLRADLVVEKAALKEWAKENLDAAAYLQLINKIDEP